MNGPGALGGGTHHRQGIAEALGAVIEVTAECRVFDRSIAGGQAENETATQ